MNPSKPKILLRALLVSYLLSGVLLLLLAFALYKLRLSEKQISLSVYVIYAAACVLGGLISGKAIGNRRFLWGLLTGLFYFITLVLVSLALDRGNLTHYSGLLPVLACCAAGGTVGGMMS
ncbi:MAG: TIGR04086 family membrane protein [Lachnospiraceae bacterium]|nr:TIGR04086 family membrane protein [Lachnospiraceae bacterium]